MDRHPTLFPMKSTLAKIEQRAVAHWYIETSFDLIYSQHTGSRICLPWLSRETIIHVAVSINAVSSKEEPANLTSYGLIPVA
jgi:hypothetical protein